jgi:hypothetical protein
MTRRRDERQPGNSALYADPLHKQVTHDDIDGLQIGTVPNIAQDMILITLSLRNISAPELQ